jgi:hypothetical protein
MLCHTAPDHGSDENVQGKLGHAVASMFTSLTLFMSKDILSVHWGGLGGSVAPSKQRIQSRFAAQVLHLLVTGFGKCVKFCVRSERHKVGCAFGALALLLYGWRFPDYALPASASWD